MYELSSAYIREVVLDRERIPDMGVYPFSLPPVRTLDRLALHPTVTFIVGENGSGKSTLLEAIAVAWGFNAEGGTRNFNFSTRASHSELGEYLTLIKGTKRPRDGYFFRAESFFTVATEIERLDEDEAAGPKIIEGFGGRSLHEQSHGESFLSLITKRFGGDALYILDEPEAALSPQRQLVLLRRMHELAAQRSQFIIATHSPILMAYPDALILSATEHGFQRVDYRDTEHYQVTRSFLDRPERSLEALFQD